MTIAVAAALTTVAQAQTPTELPPVEVIGASPLLGSGVDRAKVPAPNQVLTSKDLSCKALPACSRAARPGARRARHVRQPVPARCLLPRFRSLGATGYRARAGRLRGWCAVQRFIRRHGELNLIPDIAIDRVNLVGASPVFGLNAFGGALSVQLKDGFSYHGGELDAYCGSFGQMSALKRRRSIERQLWAQLSRCCRADWG
jgi:iron complex outermembrane recepter protein